MRTSSPCLAEKRGVATTAWEKRAPTLAQLEHAFAKMPTGTLIQRRDRTILALIVLAGCRDGALPSRRLKHIDPVERRLRAGGPVP
jgi:hypothetical protein